MWFGDDDEVAGLESEGHQQLERGDSAGALETATKLIALGWSGGFVIEALAHDARGGRQDAVSALERAVERAPADWRLWHLLGNLRSDLGHVDDAITAFDRALACEGSAQIAVRFNRAIAHRRAERFGEALADLDPILSLPKPPLEIGEAVLALTLECLAGIGRADDARNMVEEALGRCADDDPRRPRLHAEHALALDRAGAERDEVAAAFGRSVHGGVATPPLLALGRTLFPSVEEGARSRMQLVVQGDPPAGSDAAGFLRVFDVVAASPEAALEAARRYVPEHAREGLRIERCELRHPEDEREAGVYGASEIMLFT